MAMSKTRKIETRNSFGRFKFDFNAIVRVYTGPTEWYFANLPVDLSAELSELFADQKRGFGSLPVEVTSGEVKWKTSIFPDKRVGAYMLPLKAEVRKLLGVTTGDQVEITIVINV